jgi:hypothetical protein
MIEEPFPCGAPWCDIEEITPWRAQCSYLGTGKCGYQSPNTSVDAQGRLLNLTRKWFVSKEDKEAVLEVLRKIHYLDGLVRELIPFMVSDVKCAMEMGEPPFGHEDDCDDCQWFDRAKSWNQRIKLGEFDEFIAT